MKITKNIIKFDIFQHYCYNYNEITMQRKFNEEKLE